MLDDMVANEDFLREWIFEKKKVTVILAEENGNPVCFALFFIFFRLPQVGRDLPGRLVCEAEIPR